MPDFKNMDRSQLSRWYIKVVGYDYGKESPQTSLSEYRKLCAELWRLHNG